MIAGQPTAMPVNATTETHGSAYYVRSRSLRSDTQADEIEIHCCPPQLSQGHNVYGHNDLIEYACQALKSAIMDNDIKLFEDPMPGWLEGHFKVTEVHLTGNFILKRDYVLPAIQAIDDNTVKGKHRDSESAISLGFTPQRRSKRRAVTLYDKYHLLQKLWSKPGPLQQQILDDVRDSIRVELKLYSDGLAHMQLNRGRAWRYIDVGKLFFEELGKFDLIHTIQRPLTEHELTSLTNAERKCYLLWLKGVSVQEQFASRGTRGKYVNAILEKTGINIKGNKRPEAEPAVDMADVLTPGNVLPVPKWLLGTARYTKSARRSKK